MMSRHAGGAVGLGDNDSFMAGRGDVAITTEAVYEDGVLKPSERLPLREHERVHVTIEISVGLQRLATEKSPILAAHGIIGWAGDAASLEQLALSHQFGPEED